MSNKKRRGIKKTKWNVVTIKQHANEIHGNKYNYEELTEECNIKNQQSRFPVKCNTCTYRWTPTINEHIINKKGCPKCYKSQNKKRNRKTKWNINTIKQRAHEIHGDKYNYDAFTDNCLIVNQMSRFPAKCNICDHCWNPTIQIHILYKNGCPSCAGRIPWSLQKFIEIANRIHDYKYNYDLVEEKQIQSGKTSFKVICKICSHVWSTKRCPHINAKNGCPNCAGNLPWTLERFLLKANEIHGQKFNYDDITTEHIINHLSRLPIKCTICDYNWNPRITDHINNKSGCPDCAGQAPWTYERFLQKAFKIHGNLYNYDDVTEQHIINSKSLFPVSCNTCKHHWETILDYHIHHKRGCPKCKFSKGELNCCQALEFLKIPYKTQYTISPYNNRRYDFMFIVYDDKYVLEYDGGQHFFEVPHFSSHTLKERQELDLSKMDIALRNNFKVIRIDYTQMDNVQFHIEKAIKIKQQTYFSDIQLYSYIIDKL